jgi:hypothetical protein
MPLMHIDYWLVTIILFVEKPQQLTFLSRGLKPQFDSNLSFAVVGLEIRQERLKFEMMKNDRSSEFRQQKKSC